MKMDEYAVPQLVASTQPVFAEQKTTIGQLAEAASKYPYYKYNNIWTRDIQNAVCPSQY